jgi:hypothetical protein
MNTCTYKHESYTYTHVPIIDVYVLIIYQSMYIHASTIYACINEHKIQLLTCLRCNILRHPLRCVSACACMRVCVHALHTKHNPPRPTFPKNTHARTQHLLQHARIRRTRLRVCTILCLLLGIGEHNVGRRGNISGCGWGGVRCC